MADTENPAVPETVEKKAPSTEADLTKYKVREAIIYYRVHKRKVNRPPDSGRHRPSGHKKTHRPQCGRRKSYRSLYRG